MKTLQEIKEYYDCKSIKHFNILEPGFYIFNTISFVYILEKGIEFEINYPDGYVQIGIYDFNSKKCIDSKDPYLFIKINP